MTETTKRCPYCAEEILAAAVVCKHCKRDLRTTSGRQPGPSADRQWNPGVAAVLSFLIPGLGQLYKSQLLRGFGLFLMAVIGYLLFILPGLVIHLIAIVDAARSSALPRSQQVICVECKSIGIRGQRHCLRCGHVFGTPKGAERVGVTPEAR